MGFEIKLPEVGMGVTEATIVKWHKVEGDPVAADELIAEIETAKSTVEVNSPVAGVLRARLAQEGDDVEVDSVIAILD